MRDQRGLHPAGRPPAGLVAAGAALGDDALEPVLAGDGEHLVAVDVGERRGYQHTVRRGERGEPGAAVVVGGREQRLAVEVQHVEGVERHGEARAQLRRRMADVHAVLQQPEVRPARGVEHHDLPVEQDGPSPGDRADPGQLGVAGGDVVAQPAGELHLVACRRDDGAHAVPLELERPAGPLRHLPGGGEHGHDRLGEGGGGHGPSVPPAARAAVLGQPPSCNALKVAFMAAPLRRRAASRPPPPGWCHGCRRRSAASRRPPTTGPRRSPRRPAPRCRRRS